MFFLINYGMAYIAIKLSEFCRRKKIDGSAYFNLIFIFFLIVPCALQLRVGTDYDGYVEIIENNEIHFNLFIEKKEYLFAYLSRIVYLMGDGYAHAIFVLVAIIYAVMLYKIMNSIEDQGYKKSLCFVIIWLATGMMHNQLSALRNFIAVYIVIYAILNLEDRSFLMYIVAIIVASLFHQTALFFALFYYVKKINWSKVNLIYLLLLSFLFFASGLPLNILELLIEFIVPEYTRYIVGEAVASANNLNLLNLATKLIYLPIYIYAAIFLRGEYYDKLTSRRKMWFSISMFFCFAWTLIPYGGFFFRFYHYVVFFQIFTIYEVICYTRKKDKISLIFFSSIIILPYLLKVIVFPSNEYLYNSILKKWLY
jgi:hypothetical protein